MSEPNKTTAYPRWFIIWFAISIVAAVVSVIAAPIIHYFVSDPAKPWVWWFAALAWGSLACSLLKGEEYA